MQSPPFLHYLIPPRSKYSPQHHVLRHPKLPFLPQCQRPSFTPIQNNRQNYNSIYIFIFTTMTNKPLGQVSSNFQVNSEATENSRCRNGDTKQILTVDPQILGRKVNNLFAGATWRPGFVHCCLTGRRVV